MDNYEKIVSKHWGEMAKDQRTLFHWTDSSIVMEHFHKCVTGNPQMGWLQYACEKYLLKNGSGVECGLSIGCGTGSLERQCRQMNACMTMDAFDIAGGAIEEAKKLAKEEKITGINYEVRNLEKMNLPVNKYDVAFSSSAVHHIKNLESFFENVKMSLKPNGLFIMAEYVGPSQFQFSQKAVDIINEILGVLPSFYKKLSSDPTQTKESFTITPIEYMNEHDPSEAIRSHEIIPVLGQYFTFVEKKDYGGTILHMLLQDILANFSHTDFKDRLIISLLLLLEDVLIREKVLESDFSFIVVKK